MKAAVLILALSIALLFSLQPSAAADPPLFQKGQTYLVVWDCWPEWVAQVAGEQLGHGVPPCFSEIMIVQQVRSDGWLIVKNPDSPAVWSVNPARMLGFTAPPAQGMRAAQ